MLQVSRRREHLLVADNTTVPHQEERGLLSVSDAFTICVLSDGAFLILDDPFQDLPSPFDTVLDLLLSPQVLSDWLVVYESSQSLSSPHAKSK